MTLKGVDRAAAVCGIPRSRPLQGTIASHPPECGVASVSDRLDIVRLIDSKVTATRRTVARSKQLAEAAKDDLTTHAEWLERHRRQAQEESERHERRLGRRRRVEGCKRFALWLLLLVPSACAAMFRAACSGLAALGEAFYFGCCWIGTTAHALGRGRHSPHDRQCHLGRDGASHARAVGGRRVLACRLRARRRGRTRRGLGIRRRLAGLSWLGPRSRSLNHWLARALSSGSSRLAALTASLGTWLIGTIEGQIKALATRRREGSHASRRKAGAKPRPAALATGGLRPPARRA